MRIIEFGPVAIFARTHPEITTWISTGTGRGHPLSAQAMTFGFRQFARLVNCLRDRGPGLVACHVPEQALPRCRLINAAYETILRASVLPVVGLDFCDTMILTPTALRVLERCSIYFKRELPFNRAARLPTGSAVERDTLRRNLSKIIPVSLGLEAWRMEGLPDPLPTKSTDVFFSGKLHSATRRCGATLLPSSMPKEFEWICRLLTLIGQSI
jgi:hypothetical protein